MSKERLKNPRLRLFIALDLPDTVIDDVVGWCDRALPSRSDLRVLTPAAMHITLVFLGYLYEKQLPLIEKTFQSALAGQSLSPLSFGECVALPRRKPRLYALSVVDRDGQLRLMQSALASKLEAERLYRSDRRAYLPHLTVARLKRSSRENLGSTRIDTGNISEQLFDAVRVSLYSSKLRPEGASYSCLAIKDLTIKAGNKET